MRTLRLSGTLLRTVAEQRAGGDEAPVDPASLRFDPDATYALRPNFELASEPLGSVRVARQADGRLRAFGETYGEPDLPIGTRFAVGVSGGVRGGDGVTRGARLVTVAISPRNADRGIPLVRVE